ncbi:hypothetical protein JHK85_050596 [Glycine max]|nr:hypothetical protein JHK85_050596 [Glycine max]
MGCFFACFRARDTSAAATTATVPSSQEREDSVMRDDGKSIEVGSLKGDSEAVAALTCAIA